MARAKGFQGIVGRKKGATWGTAVACGANDGLRVVNLQDGGHAERIRDRGITGRVTTKKSYAGNRMVDVTVVVQLRYEGNEPDVAGLFGTAGLPATVDTSAKQHVFKLSDTFSDSIFWTLAYEFIKDTKVAEIASVMWHKLTLRGRSGGNLELELQGIGFNWDDASSTNTTTTIDTITLPANDELVLFKNLVVQVNAQGGAGLGSSDARHISAFELTVQRNLNRIFSTEFGDKTSKPIEGDYASVTGSFEFPEVKNDSPGGAQAFMADQMTLARQKAKLIATSDTLAGAATQKFQHVLWLPDLQFGEGKPGIPGPQGPTWNLPFEAHHVTAVPTGFTAGYLDACTWENFSTRAGDALA